MYVQLNLGNRVATCFGKVAKAACHLVFFCGCLTILSFLPFDV